MTARAVRPRGEQPREQPARMGRPRGTGVAASELAGRNRSVRILLHLPEELAEALRDRTELPQTAHLRVAVKQFLGRTKRTALPDLDKLDLGPGRQVWLPRELVEQLEDEYGIAQREAAILAAVAAYLEPERDGGATQGGRATRPRGSAP